MTKEMNKNRIWEWAAFALFTVLYVFITINHEPWFDEAQAWQIAKCASLKDILFMIPHYEGHPPLWHLILAIPAKLGVPYEIGLKTVGYLISALITYLILMKSPFPKAVRLLLPFNYFFFYQYGIVVRPYGLMVLLFLCLAIKFRERNEHPWQFVFVMMLLCFTHAYGILICGGISACWLYDIITEKGSFKVNIKQLISDKRVKALLVLLCIACLLILEIMPREDTYVASEESNYSVILLFICVFFSMLTNCLLLTSDWFNTDAQLLQNCEIQAISMIPAVTVGAVFFIFLFYVTNWKKFRYFIVPYICFSLFASTVYLVAHHIGVTLMLFVFWAWGILEEDQQGVTEKINKLCENSKMIKKAILIFAVICLAVPFYWSCYSSVVDVREDYGYGRNMSEFLKENKLDEALVFIGWEDIDWDDDDLDKKVLNVAVDSELLAYFDDNFIANAVNDDRSAVYKIHNAITKKEYKEKTFAWKELGVPDVLIGYGYVDDIYDDISIFDYSIVYMAEFNYLYKTKEHSSRIPVLLRNDLLEEYNLEPVDTKGVLLPYMKFTDEMKEAYLKGEKTVDDIVDELLGGWGKEG